MRSPAPSQTDDDARRWYVVQTNVRSEALAEEQLRAQGFRTFAPRIQKTVRHARKLRSVRAPAFPGYLFVQLDLGRERWRSVNGTRGVTRLIMAGALPAPAPRGVVETIISYVDEAGIAHFERDLQPGQAVRIKDGPLADAVGRLVRTDGAGRVQVLLEIMGGEVQTSLDRQALEAA